MLRPDLRMTSEHAREEGLGLRSLALIPQSCPGLHHSHRLLAHSFSGFSQPNVYSFTLAYYPSFPLSAFHKSDHIIQPQQTLASE